MNECYISQSYKATCCFRYEKFISDRNISFSHRNTRERYCKKKFACDIETLSGSDERKYRLLFPWSLTGPRGIS